MPEVPDVKRDPMEDFKSRVREKLKADIGSMMPDDVLAALVQQAAHSMFFEKRRKNVGSDYHPLYEEMPSWFEEAVAKEVEPLIRQAVQETLVSPMWKDLISRCIHDALSQDKLMICMAGVIGDYIHRGVGMAAHDIVNQLRSAGVRI